MKKWVVLLCLFSTPAVAQPTLVEVDCDLIIGDWQGEYRDDGSSFLRDDYAFRGAYDESGVVMIDFTFFANGARERHEGYWYCQDGILTTALVTHDGVPVLFQYHILHLDPTFWRYQLVSELPLPPLFEASRTTPSAMTPQFLQDYPRALFDQLLPPDIEP